MDLKLLPVASPQAKASASPDDFAKRKRSHEGLVGLVNIGNSCYMNAALQALSNCPPFRQYFVECYHPMASQSQASPHHRAADVLATLFKKMWASDKPPGHLSPRVVSSAMQNKMFRTTLQQDSQEFLRCLLMQIHEESAVEVPVWVGVASGSRDPSSSCRDSLVSSVSHDSDISNLSGEFNQPPLVTGEGRGGSAKSSPLAKKKRLTRLSLKQKATGSQGSGQNVLQSSPTNQRRFGLRTSHTKLRSGSGVKGSSESINRTPSQQQYAGSQCSLDSHCSDNDAAGGPQWEEGVVLEVDLITRGVKVHHNCHLFDCEQPGVSNCREEERREEGERGKGEIGKPAREREAFAEEESSSRRPESVHPSLEVSDPPSLEARRQPVEEKEEERIGPSVPAGSEDHTPQPEPTQFRQRKKQPGPPKMRSIVTEVFEGVLESKVKCGACKKVSVVHEPFQDLSLPIPGRKEMAKFQRMEGESMERRESPPSSKVTLSRGFCTVLSLVTQVRDMFAGPPTDIQDCLNAFFDPSELKGDNQYYCKRCKKFQNSQKEMRIVKLPEVLCMHLKRFRFDAYFSSKISRHIAFPFQNLDMSPYLKSSARHENTTYELSAIITHYGGAGGGHYVAFAKNSSHNAWYEFNDTKVRPVSLDSVMGAESYVLFYKRVPPANSVALQNMDLSSLLLPSPGASPDAPHPTCYISRHWLHLLRTCSSPGPIFQHEFSCEHGAVLPHRTEDARSLAMAIRRDVWDSFQQRYGGGPLVLKLEACTVCRAHLDSLTDRRKKEKESIHKLQSMGHGQLEKKETFLLSLQWLQQWQNFIHCDNLNIGPPGPVDNSNLLREVEGPNGTQLQLIESTNGSSNYRKLSWSTWSYFIMNYGGGPVLTTSMAPPS